METTTKKEETGLSILSPYGLSPEEVHRFPSLEQFRLQCQGFLSKLDQFPEESAIGSTPDGKAKTVLISHIEMTLDEYFFGLWETEGFKWERIANEVVGSLELIVIHPVTGQRLKRTGAASIVIMVDAAPDNIKSDRREKNRWALDMENKKSTALDMGFPKLKAECLKNAAQSFGKLFGRDLNRNIVDTFHPLLKAKERKEIPEELLDIISFKESPEEIQELWDANKELQSNPKFLQLLTARQEEILKAQKPTTENGAD